MKNEDLCPQPGSAVGTTDLVVLVSASSQEAIAGQGGVVPPQPAKPLPRQPQGELTDGGVMRL